MISLKHCKVQPVNIENGRGMLMHGDVFLASYCKSDPPSQHTTSAGDVVLGLIDLANNLHLQPLDLRSLSRALTKAVFVSFLDVRGPSSSIAQISQPNTVHTVIGGVS